MIDKSWLDHILTCRMEHCQDANKLAGALRRLASEEPFVGDAYIDQEVVARIEFARKALEDG